MRTEDGFECGACGDGAHGPSWRWGGPACWRTVGSRRPSAPSRGPARAIPPPRPPPPLQGRQGIGPGGVARDLPLPGEGGEVWDTPLPTYLDQRALPRHPCRTPSLLGGQGSMGVGGPPPKRVFNLPTQPGRVARLDQYPSQDKSS